MSQENAELVLDAFGTLEAEGIEAALAFFAPDCVWYTTDRWLEGSAYRGHEGMRHLNAAFADNFDDWGWEVLDSDGQPAARPCRVGLPRRDVRRDPRIRELAGGLEAVGLSE